MVICDILVRCVENNRFQQELKLGLALKRRKISRAVGKFLKVFSQNTKFKFALATHYLPSFFQDKIVRNVRIEWFKMCREFLLFVLRRNLRDINKCIRYFTEVLHKCTQSLFGEIRSLYVLERSQVSCKQPEMLLIWHPPFSPRHICRSS